MELRVCVQCRRHVATNETACPFCACVLSAVSAPRVVRLGRVSRAAVFSAALAACSKEPAKQAPPAPAQGSDDLEKLLDYQPRVVEQPDAAAPSDAGAEIAAGSDDAGAKIAATPVDAGVPDAGVVVKKKRRKQEQKVETIDKVRVLDHFHLAKPYGAPPARRRIV